jgi:hypothetical protein
MGNISRDVYERELVKVYIDSDGVEGFDHVEENCAG